MGQGTGKEHNHDGDEERVYDTRKIYYDDVGNICYDSNREIKDVEREVRRIMEVDVVDDEANVTYYAMDTAWITSWLAYTYFNKGVSPEPGPCRNDRLIHLDSNNNEWIVREDIHMASATWKGDYRRVSKEAWEEFLKFYPGSGPAITFEFLVSSDDKSKSRKMIPTNFKILDPPPVPKDEKKRILSSEIFSTFTPLMRASFDRSADKPKASPTPNKVSTPIVSNSHEDSESLLGSGIPYDSNVEKRAIVSPEEVRQT